MKLENYAVATGIPDICNYTVKPCPKCGRRILAYGKPCSVRCDKIDCVDIPYPAFMGKLDKHWTEDSCCTYYQLHRYFYHDRAYFWHISGLKVYDNPLELAAFRKPELPSGLRYEDDSIKRPPQSWYYVEELK